MGRGVGVVKTVAPMLMSTTSSSAVVEAASLSLQAHERLCHLLASRDENPDSSSCE